ncbi:MAG: branched-chain amino acid ABC transporter permease [Chloroflexi bacterium]|nr:MAG: branched-chain amino acid ABC transporter permease [Chloroflexota bacterium]
MASTSSRRDRSCGRVRLTSCSATRHCWRATWDEHLGLTLVWGAVRLLNLAHGALFVVGSYAAYWVVSRLNLPILVALPIGVLAAAAFAYLMHLIFIRPVIGKPGFDNSTLIATVGISIAVSAAAILIFNPEYKVVPPIISGNFTVSEVQITKQGLLVIATSLALFGLVYLFLTYTRQGMAIRAVSQQQEAASLMSIPVVRTYGMVIAISGALAGLAGVLLSPFFFLNPNSGFNPMIQALIVTIFGGLVLCSASSNLSWRSTTASPGRSPASSC